MIHSKASAALARLREIDQKYKTKKVQDSAEDSSRSSSEINLNIRLIDDVSSFSSENPRSVLNSNTQEDEESKHENETDESGESELQEKEESSISEVIELLESESGSIAYSSAFDAASSRSYEISKSGKTPEELDVVEEDDFETDEKSNRVLQLVFSIFFLLIFGIYIYEF